MATSIGFAPAALLEAHLAAWFSAAQAGAFDYAAVVRYLTAEAERQHGSTGSWWWRPLRVADVPSGWNWGDVRLVGVPGQYTSVPVGRDFYDARYECCRPYDLAVPLRVLSRVEQIVAEFGDAVKFFVTDLGVLSAPRPGGDPFICVAAFDMPRIVFDVWDEPGFSG